MTKDLVTHHNRRKIDSFEHTPTYLVVTFQQLIIIYHNIVYILYNKLKKKKIMPVF
jgi:hypothetical protein